MRHRLIFTVLFICFLSCIFYIPPDNDLNGRTFEGKATEITPPDVDRMPMMYDEKIQFENDMVRCKVLEIYGVNSCAYTSALDDRRGVAVNVMVFEGNSQGIFNGQEVSVKFSGEVHGEKNLSGSIIIRFPDDTEVKYSIEAVANN